MKGLALIVFTVVFIGTCYSEQNHKFMLSARIFTDYALPNSQAKVQLPDGSVIETGWWAGTNFPVWTNVFEVAPEDMDKKITVSVYDFYFVMPIVNLSGRVSFTANELKQNAFGIQKFNFDAPHGGWLAVTTIAAGKSATE